MLEPFLFLDNQVFTMYTYILFSEQSNRYYIGYTSNVEERLVKHNNKSKGSFTNNSSDWRVVYTKEFTSKIEAYQFERKIKSWKSRKMIENLISEFNKDV